MQCRTVRLQTTEGELTEELHEGHLVEVSLSPSIARITAEHTDTYCVSANAAVALRALVGRRIRYRLAGWEIVGFQPLDSQLEAHEEPRETGVG